MPIEIVPIREEHVEGFHGLLDQVAREKRYLLFLEAPPLENVRAFVLKSMPGPNIQFVALDGGSVVGWCDVIRLDRPTTRHAGRLGVGLPPAYREKGLGARLISAVLDEARARGIIRVELHVRADNPRAIRLYEKLGFRHEGRLVRDVKIDGHYYDSLVMAVLLDEDRP